MVLADFAEATTPAVRRRKFQPPPGGEFGDGRYTNQFVMEEEARGPRTFYLWNNSAPVPWREEGMSVALGDAADSGGAYLLGDARIHRLPDPVPGA
jgi:hypothetical protein